MIIAQFVVSCEFSGETDRCFVNWLIRYLLLNQNCIFHALCVHIIYGSSMGGNEGEKSNNF